MNNTAVVQTWSNGSTLIRVLMADPDGSLPAVYRAPLLQDGFELVTASSGLECVARLRERVPDVLVLDIEVAPIDGWQARRCALSETRNENYSNELALTKET